MIQIGKCPGVLGPDINKKNILNFENESKIVFKGKCDIAKGTSIILYRNGILEVGDDFKANQNLMILCNKGIILEDSVLCGWNVTIRDHDGHDILDENNKVINKDSQVIIRENVWLGSYVSVYKGVEIGSGTVVGGNSIVTKNTGDNRVVAGVPGRVLREGMTWKR